MENIEIGAIYRHFKGNEYIVIAIGKNTETEEEMVVYSPIDDMSKGWIRPIKMWNEIIDQENNTRRFEKVEK